MTKTDKVIHRLNKIVKDDRTMLLLSTGWATTLVLLLAKIHIF